MKKPKLKHVLLLGLAGMVSLIVLWFMVTDLARINFQSSMRSEARRNLRSILASQKDYFAKHGRYAGHEGDKKCFELLDWRPTGIKHYRNNLTYYCDNDVFASIGRDNTSCPVPDVAPVTANRFTIFAVGNSDKDPACEVWTVNESGEIIHAVNDAMEEGKSR